MARYFAGNSLASFSRTSTTITESTTSGRFNSSFVSSCILIPSNTVSVSTATFAATGTVWFRFDCYTESSTGGTAIFTAYNGTTGIIRWVPSSTAGAHQFQYWNGSTWTNTGSTFSYSHVSLATMVVRVDLNSGFTAYVGGTQVATGSGWTGGPTTATLATFTNNGGGGTSISQVMIADYDIRDSKFMPAALNGNSAANTGGTGAYTTVNETVLDDSTALTVATAGNKQGQTHAALTIPAGYIIGAAVLAGRGRVSGTITDGKLGLRTSGGTNSSGSGLGFNGGYEPRLRIIDNDPGTATNFTQAGFNAAEIYEEAV